MLTIKTKRKKKIYPSQEFSNLKGPMRQRLVAERKKLGLSQSQLGLQVGVSGAMIASLESGRSKPGLEVYLMLQEVFKVSGEELFPDF
ncbi:helix-turn-helix transcriptional regulator [Cytobacillus horneckiae]|uniref:helix-turn-helix transcriptional regulator n=1 Tax=Cytobacillus horneckiae TaxID=549687 RepID=UPI0013040AF9|nr:helix-turn-helix transcriptional regulator [Cytobacillus horneckiae]